MFYAVCGRVRWAMVSIVLNVLNVLLGTWYMECSMWYGVVGDGVHCSSYQTFPAAARPEPMSLGLCCLCSKDF